MRTTLVSYLEDFIARGAETAFVHQRGLRVERSSYGLIATDASRFAWELEARRIARGDRILLWARNCPQWVAAFFGCLLRGVVVVPLDVHSEPGFVKQVQGQVEAKLALCDAETAARLEGLLPAIELEELSTRLAHHPAAPYPLAGINPDDTVEIVFTSGATAAPKGVVITHRNLLTNLAPLEQESKRYLKWERFFHPIRFLNLLPLSHLFGQFMGIFVPQLFGGEVFFQESLGPSQIVETIK